MKFIKSDIARVYSFIFPSMVYFINLFILNIKIYSLNLPKNGRQKNYATGKYGDYHEND